MTPAQTARLASVRAALGTVREHGTITGADGAIGLWWTHDRGHWTVLLTVHADGAVGYLVTPAVPGGGAGSAGPDEPVDDVALAVLAALERRGVM